MNVISRCHICQKYSVCIKIDDEIKRRYTAEYKNKTFTKLNIARQKQINAIKIKLLFNRICLIIRSN